MYKWVASVVKITQNSETVKIIVTNSAVSFKGYLTAVDPLALKLDGGQAYDRSND
jgi:hypothetical protein